MLPDIITSVESELGKRLNPRTTEVTRTDMAPVIIARGRKEGRLVERCLRVRHDGRWEITGYPQHGERARLLANDAPRLGGGSLHPRDLRRIEAIMCATPTGGTE